MDIPKKIQLFESQLEEAIVSKEIAYYHEALQYGLTNGFLPKHVNKAIQSMYKAGKIKAKPVTVSQNVHKLTSSEKFQL